MLSEWLCGVYYQLGLKPDINEESKAFQTYLIAAAADLIKLSQTRYKINLFDYEGSETLEQVSGPERYRMSHP